MASIPFLVRDHHGKSQCFVYVFPEEHNAVRNGGLKAKGRLCLGQCIPVNAFTCYIKDFQFALQVIFGDTNPSGGDRRIFRSRFFQAERGVGNNEMIGDRDCIGGSIRVVEVDMYGAGSGCIVQGSADDEFLRKAACLRKTEIGTVAVVNGRMIVVLIVETDVPGGGDVLKMAFPA